MKYIRKESNGLEDVESGLAHCEQNVYTEYLRLTCILSAIAAYNNQGGMR